MRHRPRVVMIGHGYLPQIGGAEKISANLAEGLVSRGFDMHVIARRTEGLLSCEVIRGVHVHRIAAPGPRYVAAAITARLSLACLRRLRPDLIHAHTMLSPSIISTAYKRFVQRIPVLVTIHRGGPAPYGEVARFQRKYAGRRRLSWLGAEMDAFLAVSEEIEHELRAVPGISAKVRLLENGVDSSKIWPLSSDEKLRQRKALDLPEGPVVLFVGRLSLEKRVSQLLDIWPDVQLHHPSSILCVLGDGPQRGMLTKRAVRGVSIRGVPADVIPYLQAGDLFVLPSVAEGLSIAMLEAMAAGLPVVVTDVGGAAQVIVQGENGRLIKPDNPEEMLQTLVQMLSDEPGRREMGVAARATVLDRFNIDDKTDQLADVYNQLLSVGTGVSSGNDLVR